MSDPFQKLVDTIARIDERHKSDNMNPLSLPMIVTERWAEAVAKNDTRTWRACWQLAELEASIIEKHEPDNVLVAALEGIANDAHARYLALMPKSA